MTKMNGDRKTIATAISREWRATLWRQLAALGGAPAFGGERAHRFSPWTCTQRSEVLMSSSVQTIVAPNSTHAIAEA